MSEKIKSQSTFAVDILLKLTEEEARALQQICKYSSKQFLEFFYEKLGKVYLQPHERGVHSLFKTIETELPAHLRKADDVRAVWLGEKTAINVPPAKTKA